jgi:hypothetical protein
MTDLWRREIDMELQGPPLSDAEWGLVRNRSETHLRSGEIDPAGVAAEVAEARSAFGAPKEPFIAAPIRGNPARNARADLLSAMLSNALNSDGLVTEFREDVLDAGLIPLDKLDVWIRDKATAEGYSAWLEVPVAPLSKSPFPWVLEEGRVFPTEPLTISEDNPAAGFHYRWLEYTITGETLRRVKTAQGGVLERLRVLSVELSKIRLFQVVPASDLVPLVLSGHPFRVNALSQDINLAIGCLSRVNLSIDPTLSPREVANAYSEMRKAIFPGRYRAMSEKHIRLAIFSATSPPDERLKSAMTRWNKLFPKWRYCEETNFGRDSKVAIRRARATLFEARDKAQSSIGWVMSGSLTPTELNPKAAQQQRSEIVSRPSSSLPNRPQGHSAASKRQRRTDEIQGRKQNVAENELKQR